MYIPGGVLSHAQCCHMILKKVSLFNCHTLYMLVFQVLSSNMPSILLEHIDMGAHYLILCKNSEFISNIGNLFLERITYNIFWCARVFTFCWNILGHLQNILYSYKLLFLFFFLVSKKNSIKVTDFYKFNEKKKIVGGCSPLSVVFK